MKNRILILAALLPLLSFGYDIIPYRFVVFHWLGFAQPSASIGNASAGSPVYRVNSSSDIVSILSASSNFGFAVNFRRQSYNANVIVPARTVTFSTGNYNTASTITNSLQVVSNGVYYLTTPLIYDDVSKIYSFCASLFVNGYDGPGFPEVFNDGSYVHCVNVNYPALLADLSSSTNSVYRQLLLSHLSSLSSSLSSIDSSVGFISSDSSRFLSLYQAANPLSVASLSNAVQSAFEQSLISFPLKNSFLSTISEFSDPFYDQFPADRAVAYNSVLRSLDSLGSSLGIFQDLENSFFRNPTLSRSALNHLGDFFSAGGAYHYTTPLTNELQKLNTNWVSQTKAALSNNTQQIKDQLNHMFDNPADSSTVGGGIANISRAAGVLAGTVNNNRVMVTVENATPVSVLLDGPVNIDQAQLTQLSTPLAGLERRVDAWYQDWYSFYSPNVSGYNWVQFFDMVSSFKDVNHTDLVSLQSIVSNLLVSILGDITNSVVSTNGYLLLSDYADYIHSGGLDSLLDVMDDDSYSDLKAEIDSLYHSDTAEGYGRWWRYFTGLSTVQANSIFKLSNIFQAHEKLLKDLKRDNSDFDVEDVSDPSLFRKLLYTIPSEEDTFNKLSQLTNSIDQSGFARVQLLIPDLTNRFNAAASLYDKDFVLPSEISWELIPGDPSINSPSRIVTIRPSEHYRLFQMLHFGLAFSYCLVNIILFPKFLLFLVRLFDRVWNKSEKLIYNSTQS